MAPSIMWFRRDLRLGDHPALHEAVRRGGSDGVLPLFILDEEFLAPAGPDRAAFVAASLDALSGSMGAPIVLRRGDPTTILVDLVKESGASSVVISADFGPQGRRRDERARAALSAIDVDLVEVSSPYVVDPGIVRGESGAPLKVFTAFKRRWEVIGPPVVLPTPDVRWLTHASDATTADLVAAAGTRRPGLFGELPDRATATPPPAGEEAALERLTTFIERDVDAYRDQRDQFAVEGTSRLSPYLHVGSIHPRTALLAASGAGGGRSTFISELCWREFYADVLFHHPSSVRSALQAPMAGLEWDQGQDAEARFRQWAAGQTGIPLVDAAMRQLLEEGWMHNRGRMLAASFLVKHLHLDWRWGARWFMWRLIDGDLASNQHGWQWTAGTGTDAAPFHRIFSPVAQAERFDPDGAYIHRYVPELRGIAAPGVLQPGGGVSLLDQSSYPPPMIDLKVERAEALRRAHEARERYRATS